VNALDLRLLARLCALGAGGVIVQTAAVSQLPIAGANADLSPLLVMAVGLLCGSTLLFALGFALMQFLLGVDAPVSWALLRQTLATLVVNALIAVPVFALVRRTLAGSLPDDPRRRRRRAYTTGGLSPLSRGTDLR